MKMQPKQQSLNNQGLGGLQKNNSGILNPLTQHLQAALKQHQALQQQQVSQQVGESSRKQ